ncbi:MAG: hypothetical protein HY319_03320 [Armatimonadetes bacterium]|nr:hypothetical protein [Armatimonadota bacterium]
MKNFLCSRPENVWGGVFYADRELEFTERLREKPGARVFALDISDNLTHPRVVANEVRRAIDAIKAATGASRVNVITHSMGALTAREARRQGENDIGKLCMISAPNHGSYEASLGSTLHDANVYDHYPGERMGAMDALRLEYGPLGGVANQWLHELNEFWKDDPDRPQALVIAGIGLPTPDRSLPVGTAQGDAMVAARRAPLDGAGFLLAVPNKLEPGHPFFRDFQEFRYNHLQIVSEAEVYRAVAEFLNEDPPAPPRDPAPPPPPPGDFERHLSAVQDRNRDLRKSLAASEHRIRLAARWHQMALLSAAFGVGAGLAGAALYNVFPLVGTGLMAAGGATAAAGTSVAIVQARQAQREGDEAARTGEAGLNLSDDLIHRFRRSTEGLES